MHFCIFWEWPRIMSEAVAEATLVYFEWNSQEMWLWYQLRFAIFFSFYSHEPISHKFTFKLYENFVVTLYIVKYKSVISPLLTFHMVECRCTLNKDDQIRLLVTLFTVPSVYTADTKVHSNMIQNACCLRSELQKQTCMLSLIHVFEFGKKYR